jgi:hypothetical protein
VAAFVVHEIRWLVSLAVWLGSLLARPDDPIPASQLESKKKPAGDMHHPPVLFFKYRF